MKYLHDILLRPVITEKATYMAEQQKYVFEVAVTANKVEIGKAVEAAFADVKVASVNTINCRGKLKRHGRFFSRRPKRKKAIVTLHKDSKAIELFE